MGAAAWEFRGSVRGSDCSATPGNAVELLHLPRRWTVAPVSQFIVSLMSDVTAKSALAKLLRWPKQAAENQIPAECNWHGHSGLPPAQSTRAGSVGEPSATHRSDGIPPSHVSRVGYHHARVLAETFWRQKDSDVPGDSLLVHLHLHQNISK